MVLTWQSELKKTWKYKCILDYLPSRGLSETPNMKPGNSENNGESLLLNRVSSKEWRMREREFAKMEDLCTDHGEHAKFLRIRTLCRYVYMYCTIGKWQVAKEAEMWNIIMY